MLNVPIYEYNVYTYTYLCMSVCVSFLSSKLFRVFVRPHRFTNISAIISFFHRMASLPKTKVNSERSRLPTRTHKQSSVDVGRKESA